MAPLLVFGLHPFDLALILYLTVFSSASEILNFNNTLQT